MLSYVIFIYRVWIGDSSNHIWDYVVAFDSYQLKFTDTNFRKVNVLFRNGSNLIVMKE